jgi:DNA gyrase subunit A
MGRCMRFPVPDVRVFAGRASDGVRGIRLSEGDTVLSMAVLQSVAVSGAERTAFLRRIVVDESDQPPEDDDELGDAVTLSAERIAELEGTEQFVLTVSSEGFGKRTSAYDFPRTGRGGQGRAAQDLAKTGGRLVASFPVEEDDQILLVTDQGQLIRMPVDQIRIARRKTKGVTLFRTAEDEHVVSAERLEGEADDDPDEDETETEAEEQD